MAVLDAIKTAWLDRERARLKLPSRQELEEKRAIEARAAAESASQLESAGVGRDYDRAKLAALPAEQDLQRRATEALITDRLRPPQPPRPAAPHYITDAKGNVRAVTMGEQGFDIKDLGAIGTPQRETGAGGGLSPFGESNILNRLTTQWDKANSTVSELRHQSNLMQQGLAAARKGDMNAGSQAVLVTFQKILDPTSVVRESEYARSPQGLALIDRIRGLYPRVSQGGPGVPIDELESFAALANQFVEQATTNRNLQSIRGRIGLTADRYKIPHDLIFGPSLPADPAITPPAPGTPAGPAAPVETWTEVQPGMFKLVKK